MKFVIYTPNYTDHCGGIVALHNLGWELQSLGHEVRIAFANVINPTKPLQLLRSPFDTDMIAIYPEIYPNNPLGLRKCVRWILSPIGEDWKELRRNDMIVSWSNWDNNPTLFVPLVDYRFFNLNDARENRTLKLVYKLPAKPNELELSDYHTNLSGLADLFKQALYLRCGDRNTSINEMARLCGCPVLLEEADRDWVFIGGSDGIAFNESELDSAREKTSTMKERYDKYIEDSRQSILNFIERCGERWG